MVLDIVLGQLLAVAQHDEHLEPLAEFLVVDPQRGNLLDSLVTGEQLLDLPGKHVLAAGDDHLVVTARR